MIIKIFDIFIKLMGLLWFFNCSTKFLLCPALLVFGSSFFHTPPVKLPPLLPSSVRGVLFPFATSFIWPKRVRDTRSACSIALFSICSDGGRSQEEPLRGARLFRRPFLPGSKCSRDEFEEWACTCSQARGETHEVVRMDGNDSLLWSQPSHYSLSRPDVFYSNVLLKGVLSGLCSLS